MPRTRRVARGNRLAPAERRQQILQAAVALFAEEGFGASTRSLAQKLGITQPLIYRYFPTKDDLIAEVYDTVFVGRWSDAWETMIGNRALPIRRRFHDFYIEYTHVVFAEDWMRIYLFSGLRKIEINRWWSGFVEDRVLRLVCNELRAEFGAKGVAEKPPTSTELELLWSFQGGIFYYAMRKDVYRSRMHLDFPRYLEIVIDGLLASFRMQLENEAS